MLPTIEPGQILSFAYPVHNRWGIPLEYRERTITVVAIRDVRRQPLDSATIIACPTRRRGTLLIEGIDHECGERRTFWWESMRFSSSSEHFPRLQLAIIPHDEPDDSPEPVGPVFRQSLFDSMVLAATVRHLRESFPEVEARYRVVAIPVAEDDE
jgi:hypothetical protein